MDRKEKKIGLDFRFLPRALAAWLITSCLLLLMAASIITAADLKASCFGAFGCAVGFCASVSAGFVAAKNNPLSALKLSLLTAGALIILLLTLGFVISGESMSVAGILSVAAVSLVGCVFGVSLRVKTSKNYKKKTKSFLKKRSFG